MRTKPTHDTMADTPHDDAPPAGAGPAAAATGGEAENVVPMPGRAAAGAAPSPQSADAPGEGEGGAKPAGKKRKPKQVNWGAVNTLLEHFALIYGTDTVWDGQMHRIVKVGALRLAWGNDPVKMWLAHQDRRLVYPEDLVFEPGEAPAGKVNMWRGFEVAPLLCEASEVAPMLRLLRHLCSTSGPTGDDCMAVEEWLLRWMALPLQRPGAKMQTAIVMHGPQGTGKNLFFDAWRDLFGQYGVTVSQTEIEDKFNSWLSCKLAIVGDEVVSRQEMYHNKNRLKLVVTTAQKFPIRAMMQETRWESNHANVVFLSNESQPLAIEDKDRRYLVVYTPTADDTGLYAEVRAFLANDGLRKWMHYLLTFPLDDFAEHTKPVMTVAKERLIELGLKPAQRFMAEWLEGFLPLPMRVCSTGQLFRAFCRWADQAGERWPGSQAQFTRDAERYSLEQVEHEGGRRLAPRLTVKVVRLKHSNDDRKAVRCWVPRDLDPPDGVSEGEWAAGSVDAFEQVLRAFVSASRGTGGGDDE